MALVPPTSNVNFMPYDVYAHHGRQMMQVHNDRLKEILGIPSNLSPVRLKPVNTVRSAEYNESDTVGILGAGLAAFSNLWVIAY